MKLPVKNVSQIFSETKVMSWNCLFWQSNSPNTIITIFTMKHKQRKAANCHILKSWKQQVFGTSEQDSPVSWHSLRVWTELVGKNNCCSCMRLDARWWLLLSWQHHDKQPPPFGCNPRLWWNRMEAPLSQAWTERYWQARDVGAAAVFSCYLVT